MPKLKRQQIIILSIMAVAVIYGVYDLFIAPKNDTKTVTSIGKTVDMGTFLSDVSASTLVSQLSALDMNIIKKAEAPWQRNPFFGKKAFREWTMIKEPAKAGSGTHQSFIYSGYLKASNKNIAIINGVEYEAGDELEEEGYILKKVYQNKIVIQNSKSGSKFEVLLQE